MSKAEIDRLGDQIREEKINLTDATLDRLQDHRISHRNSLSVVFTKLCKYTRQVHPSSIVTYRIKRFESIISKLHRYHDMRFSRMWDIGGCRCILRNNRDLEKLLKYLESDGEIEIVKKYDYLQKPQEDGYKSFHVFIKCKNQPEIIEVQLRNTEDHNWATLVEITDFLYDLKLKEIGNDERLVRFHFLLSKKNSLSVQEKKEIAETVKKYNYFERLSEVFSKNYLKVRVQWNEIQNQNKHKYFLIETRKDQTPKILSFESAIDAENHYFQVYKSSENANIVLTHLHSPNISQLSVAYSNYILTFHTFIDDCYVLLESLIFDSIQKGKYFSFYRYFKLYNSLLYLHIKNLLEEVKEFNDIANPSGNNHKKFKGKEKDWVKDIIDQIYKVDLRRKKLNRNFRNNFPKKVIPAYLIRSINRFIITKYKKKFSNLEEKYKK